MSREMERIVSKTAVAYFIILFRYLPVGTEYKRKK
jgi:hypothetical protein